MSSKTDIHTMLGFHHFSSSEHAGYRFGFNGMEKDDEVKGSGNSYDFGARMLDVRIGRWMAVDPARKMYPGITPYSFAANSPIFLLDPNGKWVVRINTADDGVQSLAFDPEPGDNLASLACQLGLPDGEVFDALRESGDLINIANGRSVSLQSLETVKNINGYLNSDVESTNCANCALASQGIESTPFTEDFGASSTAQANEYVEAGENVSEGETRIGDVTTFKHTEESSGNFLKSEGIQDVLGPEGKKILRPKAEVDAEIKEWYMNQSVAAHFTVILLKDKTGTQIQQSLEKAGSNPLRVTEGVSSSTDFEPSGLNQGETPHYSGNP